MISYINELTIILRKYYSILSQEFKNFMMIGLKTALTLKS